ncbi:MAG TPA: hypothetical protein DCZ03_08415 [Gammaproteobacteria bacterium]|nr:hypothetical protein [Gammaproteobacteria bacterium]
MTLVLIMLSAFWVGLAGAGHCLSMCSGFSGMAATDLSTGIPRWQNFALVQLGRISSYLLVGAVLAAGLQWLELSTSDSLLVVGHYFALFMLLGLALYLFGFPQLLLPFEKLGGWIWRPCQRLINGLFPIQRPSQAFAFGLLWGWLPCGMVYAVAALALSTGVPYQGALVMVAFGIGTLPAIYSSQAILGYLTQQVRQSMVRKIGGCAVLLVAILNWYIHSLSQNTAHFH